MLPDHYRLAAAMMVGTDQARVDALLRGVEARISGGYRAGAPSLRLIARESGLDHAMVVRDVQRYMAILRWAATEMEPAVEVKGKSG